MSQDKKQRLKSAAYVIFSRKGYKATGISEIAKQAGMAVGSFYNYYDSRKPFFWMFILMKITVCVKQ